MELNDAGTLALRDHSGREFADMIVDQFEEMLEQSEKQPLVFSLSLHGFIVGQPFRLRPLRQAIKHCVEHKHKDQVWFTRAGEIAKYCFAMARGSFPEAEPGECRARQEARHDYRAARMPPRPVLKVDARHGPLGLSRRRDSSPC